MNQFLITRHCFKKQSAWLLAGLFIAATGTTEASTLLFSDNFNVANATLDASAQGPNRYSGLLAGTTESHAALAQSNIVNQQLSVAANDTAVRFVSSTDLTLRRNFSEGATGAAILAAGGFQVSLDRIQSTTANTNWVGIGVGAVIAGSDAWIGDGALDFGFLLRNNGNAQRFDNGLSLEIASAVIPTLTTQHYVFTFLLDPQAANPFADGSNVTVSATVDGVAVPMAAGGATSYTFQWAGNNGNIQIQYFWSASGGSIDNLSIATVPEPSLSVLGALVGVGMLARRRRA